MFDLANYKKELDILNKQNNYCKLVSNQQWYNTYCIFCDDKTRPNAKSHGHFYISRYFNFGHCFRCEHKTSITEFMNFFGINIYIDNSKITFINKNLFIKNTPEIRNSTKFENYIIKRLGHIDCNFYKIYLEELESKEVCTFYNYFNQKTVSRFIDKHSIRYFKHSNHFYYFQNPLDLKFKEITICEGPFDIIKIYESGDILNSLYFSINGKSYSTSIEKIFKMFLINHEINRINVVIDNDIKFKIFSNRNIRVLRSTHDDIAASGVFV